MPRILFDQNVPRALAQLLTDYEIRTAADQGWEELENGNLLKAAEDAGFSAMATADQNIRYQQNLAGRKIALVVLSTNNWKVLRDNIAPITAALARSSERPDAEVRLVPLRTRRRRPSWLRHPSCFLRRPEFGLFTGKPSLKPFLLGGMSTTETF